MFNQIVNKGKEAYLGYLLLDMLNDKKGDYFTLGTERGISLNDYVAKWVKLELRESERFSQREGIKIGNRECKILLEKSPDGSFKVEIVDLANELESETPLKPKNEYTDRDFLNLCNKHELTFRCNQNDRSAFSTKVGDHLIGGVDKIDLYPIHIANLYDMIKHLENGKDINMLVAMATGSGKSFTQALFALVLEMAGFRGIFVVHRESLIGQLKEDFNRLLPTSLTEKLKACQKGTDAIDPESHIITTHDLLFKERSSAFKEVLKSNAYWICIDEAHRAVTVELYKKEIEQVKAPICFLTATPSEGITEKVGRTIYLSPEEKEKAGICKKDIKKQTQANSHIKKAKTLSFLDRFGLWLADLVDPERLSVAHELIDIIEESGTYRALHCPFYIQNSEARHSLRWNTHLAIGKKILALVGRGSEEAVINFHLKLHGSDLTDGEINRLYEKLHAIKRFKDLRAIDFMEFEKLSNSNYSAYERGNKVSRCVLHIPFGVSLLSQHRIFLDGGYAREYEMSKKALRRASLSNYLMHHHKMSDYEASSCVEKHVDYSSNAAKYQEFNVLNGLIEMTLSYLTGYDRMTLNHKRRHDLDSLVEKAKQSLSERDLFSHKDQILTSLLGEEIPPSIAETIANQGFVILKVLNESMIKKTLNEEELALREREIVTGLLDRGLPPFIAEDMAEQEVLKESQDPFFKTMVDNWSLDKKIHEQYANENGSLSQVQEFCKRHKTVFMMSGMEKTSTEIEENRPFFNLIEKRFNLNAEKNEELKNRLKRNYSMIERLSDGALQYYYEPNYCHPDYTEEVIDILFKKGLIGAYITSEKTTGFNDPNLSTVGVVVTRADENINTPDELAQSDRNRKLDWAEQSFYFLATKKGIQPSFNVDQLSKGNYIPALNKARKAHHKALLKRLGWKIAEQIQEYICTHTEPSGRIDPSALENQLLEVIWEEYETLYNQNNHDPKKTKKEFICALNDTYKELYLYEKEIKKNYILSISSTILMRVLELITKIIYWFTSYSIKELQKELDTLPPNENLNNEKTYVYLLKNYKYKESVRSKTALDQLSKLAFSRLEEGKRFIAQNFHRFIKEEKQECFDRGNRSIRAILNQLVEKSQLEDRQKKELVALMHAKECWLNEQVLSHIRGLIDPSDKREESNGRASRFPLFDLIASDFTIKRYLKKEKISKEILSVDPELLDWEGFTELGLEHLPNDYEHFIDENIDAIKSETYLISSIAHYFQSDRYRKLLNDCMSPLKRDQLLTIINAIYGTDGDNEQKVHEIQEFVKAINDKKEFTKIVENCGGLEEAIRVKKYIDEIVREILNCQFYYRRIDEKGMPLLDKGPVSSLLKGVNNKILEKRDSSIEPIGLIHSKVQFMSASLHSLKDLSEIELLDNRDKIEHMQTAAEELKSCIASLKNPNKEGKIKEIEKVASKLSHLPPLAGSTYYNAVQQARSSSS